MFNRLLIAVPVVPILLFAGFWNPSPGSGTEYDSGRWIDSGLEHERAGDLPTAEHDFLEAATVDRLFQPRWTLAGFYFRRANEPQFWQWARSAFSTGQRDLGALFDLCWRVTGDPEKISAAMPDRLPVLDEYLPYLMTTDRWNAAASVAARIAAQSRNNEKPLLLNYCDAALARHDNSGASVVWKSLCRRGLLPFSISRLLTNGDFQTPPSGRGFDWTAPLTKGTAASFRSGEATFTLDGFEPDRVPLLQQPLALTPAAIYHLTFEYKTSGLNSIHWQAGEAASVVLVASDWTRADFAFPGRAPALTLVYQRASGAGVGEGTISLRGLDIVQK